MSETTEGRAWLVEELAAAINHARERESQLVTLSMFAAYKATILLRAADAELASVREERATPEEIDAIDGLLGFWDVENSGADDDSQRRAAVVREFIARQRAALRGTETQDGVA